MYRKRSANKRYSPSKSLDELKSGLRRCPFCHAADLKIKQTNALSYVIHNIYPYHYWEFMGVVDHLLIVPKRHVESLSELSNNEKLEIMNMIAMYEQDGYNVYARTATNSIKTVPHQHTHLIKTNNKLARLFVHLRKPYLLLQR